MSRRLVWGLATIGGLIIVVAVLVGASFVSGSVRTQPDAAFTVRLAMLDVPVADERPVIEKPDQYLGVLHPEPTFDTTGLGPELTFSQRPEDLEPLEPGTALRAVYLGHDQFGDPYHIWHAASSNFRNLIGQIIVDFGSFGRLGTSYGTLTVGDGLFSNSQEQTIEERGLTSGYQSVGSRRPATLVVEWHALPEEVAAVAFIKEGASLGWQAPISGTAALKTTEDVLLRDFDVEMVAYTASGDEWNRWP